MIGIGIIGAGGIVPPHLKAIAAHPGARALHIADVRPEAAHKLAQEYGIALVSTDPAAVVNDPDVSLVIIALPTFLHEEWITRCARVGKHVLTEKPLCRTVAQGQHVIAACAEHRVQLAVGYMRRFSPARLRVRELVQSGVLGRPVTWSICAQSPRTDCCRGPNNWMWQFDQGAGLVMDGSIHDFDFACWVLGQPAEMFAQSRCISDVVTAPTQASAIVRFAQGDNLVYDVAWQEGDYGNFWVPMRLIGPKGTLVIEGDHAFTWYYEPGKKQTIASELGADVDPFVYLFARQLDSFIKLVGGAPRDISLTSGEEALLSLWLSENIAAAGPMGTRIPYAV